MTDRKPLFFSRLKDKSLEAYKAWINEMAEKMGVKGSDMTEEEWEAAWKKFWAKSETNKGINRDTEL